MGLALMNQEAVLCRVYTCRFDNQVPKEKLA